MPNTICPCGHSLPRGTLCPCRAMRKASADKARGSSSSRGYGSKWVKESRAFLAALGEPLCACGCGRKADMVDHIIAAKGDTRLFWDRKNWQPYNGACNRRKAIKFEGAFGR